MRTATTSTEVFPCQAVGPSMTLAVPSISPPSSRRPTRDGAAEARIRDVLDGGVAGNPRLAMVFQPVVDLRTGRVVGAEALARFKSDPYRTPDLWFDDARRCRRGVELELLAIEIALSQLAEMGPSTYLAVNVSPETLVSSDLQRIMGGVPGERVVIELTEHARVDDYAGVQAAVAWLRARGTRLAVDDAGAGFASFQHILRLQPDVIKLDRSLTSGVDGNPVRHALASAMVSFAASLGAKICAEGIETLGEIVALQQLGITYGQGYFLAKPSGLPMPEPPTGIWYNDLPEDLAPPSTTIASPALRSPARLASLRSTELLDTDAEAAFDRFTALASRLLRAPVALMSLLDDRRQFFKSTVGVGDLRGTPLTHSICAHTVTGKAPLIIEDAVHHPLVKDNPAIPAFGIGAYAGVPIITEDNQAIGALCVLDLQARPWTENDVRTLLDLGALVAAKIDSRKATRELTRRALLLDAIFQKSELPIVVYDVEGRLERASSAALALLGKTQEELHGVRSADIVHPDDAVMIMAARDELLAGRSEQLELILRYPMADGSFPRRRMFGSIFRDPNGAVQFFVVTFAELVER